jgi:kinesin family protein C2/C3
MFQTLKREHVSLSDQVKLTFESFPGLDVLKFVQLLGKTLTNIFYSDFPIQFLFRY